MKRIYEAESALEAQILEDLLRQQGVEAYVEGSFLQGAAGELPVSGLVGISVSEADVTRALNILKAWDNEQVEVEEKFLGTTKKPLSLFFILGLTLGALAVYVFYQLPERVITEDYNLDGHIDVKYIYKHGRLSKGEFDNNSDGKIDGIYLYNRYGEILSAKFDNDFDGKFETKVKYYLGQPFDESLDVNADGKVDLIYEYDNGVITLSKLISPQTGKVKKISYFHLGKLIKSEFDSNDDGVLDRVVTYDFYEEPITSK